ncbi:KAP family P-loop NTPase fold protein [Rhodococcus aetherivorans]|uniref:KAP family P-loop NTPase fold protein n=1 Tax=Rhodococcus aetherivorans TaxID=191292 RepID=UPI00294A1D23|nr:P-loop NTPase fold protein [Rhodococcus aetherivorans]MDV6291472.1 P-loop NTPase fold protein [Rhodococcus aetherivorans]
MTDARYPLWSDEPADRDLLSFDAVASTVVDAVLDDALDPIALGLSGSWGSGKTSVLELVQSEINARNASGQAKILVIATQPWSYDPAVGPKESLIAEVLDGLAREIQTDAGDTAKSLLKRLTGRVQWAKAFKVAAKAGIALQLPSVDDVLGLIKEEPNNDESPDRGLAGFREDFEELLASDGLQHISRVVVLVDDLDRCLPETVVETLEAIRLFLSAKGMSFVIAADEDRVADAIQQRLKTPDERDAGTESPAKLYLHKIVQTTIPLPGLSRFDTHAYLFLLLSEGKTTSEVHDALVASCAELRRSSGSLDDVVIPAGIDLAEELAVASRLTPILYEKFRGNPRRIKRFLNDLNVRQSVSHRRGITLPSDAVAKLMVLERLLRPDFETVLQWLAQNKLRDQLDALEQAANAPTSVPEEEATEEESLKPKAKGKTAPEPVEEAPKVEGGFSDTLIRWAKLPPTLDASDVGGYLYLAASFAGIELIDDGLPERLRDIASALTSSLKTERSAINDDALRALDVQDARTLITHLGSQTRDQPSIQKYSVAGMTRLAHTHKGIDDAVVAALKLLPPAAVQVATVMLLKPEPRAIYEPVLTAWTTDAASDQVKQAIATVRRSWSDLNGN